MTIFITRISLSIPMKRKTVKVLIETEFKGSSARFSQAANFDNRWNFFDRNLIYIKNKNIYLQILSRNSLILPIRVHFKLANWNFSFAWNLDWSFWFGHCNSLITVISHSETAMSKGTFTAFYKEILNDFLMSILKDQLNIIIKYFHYSIEESSMRTTKIVIFSERILKKNFKILCLNFFSLFSRVLKKRSVDSDCTYILSGEFDCEMIRFCRCTKRHLMRV